MGLVDVGRSLLPCWNLCVNITVMVRVVLLHCVLLFPPLVFSSSLIYARETGLSSKTTKNNHLVSSVRLKRNTSVVIDEEFLSIQFHILGTKLRPTDEPGGSWIPDTPLL